MHDSMATRLHYREEQANFAFVFMCNSNQTLESRLPIENQICFGPAEFDGLAKSEALFAAYVREGYVMFRVEIFGSADTLRLKLQGRFAAGDAEHTRLLLARCPANVTLVVDLTEVVFVDIVGEEVLSFFGRLGGSL